MKSTTSKNKQTNGVVDITRLLTADEMDDVLGNNITLNDFVASKLEEMLQYVDLKNVTIQDLTKELSTFPVISSVDVGMFVLYLIL
jgi:hypothetical protein